MLCDNAENDYMTKTILYLGYSDTIAAHGQLALHLTLKETSDHIHHTQNALSQVTSCYLTQSPPKHCSYIM